MNLIAGLADDPTFGPVVVFGRGGTAVEVINDKALALPPLDINLAKESDRANPCVTHPQELPRRPRRERKRGRIAAGQARHRWRRIIPEIRELDINPLLADKDGVIAVDARVAIATA